MRAKQRHSSPQQSSAAADRSDANSHSTSPANSQRLADSNKAAAFSSTRPGADSFESVKQLRGRDQSATLQTALNRQASSSLLTNARTSQTVVDGLAANRNSTQRPEAPSAVPAQRAEKGVVQRALIPLAAFKGQFKDDRETQANLGVEYHAQICDDLENYHKFEFDLNKSVSEELYSGKWEARGEQLLHLLASIGRFINTAGKRGAEGSRGKPLTAVETLRRDASHEYENYYKNESGRKALHTLLAVKAEQQRMDVYAADEFKEDANLGVVSSNFGDIGDVVSKLKAFHAIKEKPQDDSTRASKLALLNALLVSAAKAKESIGAEQNKQLYKANTLGFVQSWHEARVNALNKLTDMLKSNKGKYEDAITWRLNLQDALSRNKDAAEGRGVSMSDAKDDSNWVEVDDGYASEKELAAETDEIVKRLSGGGGN